MRWFRRLRQSTDWPFYRDVLIVSAVVWTILGVILAYVVLVLKHWSPR